MSQLPRISIVVPNFNQGEFLSEALDSILSQNYASLELIVIDGGSTDSSLNVIHRYENQITYWCSEKDQGHYDAVNKGFRRATGEILAFLNSDDKYFQGSLHIIAEVFSSHPEVRWATSVYPAGWDLSGNCISIIQIPGYARAAFLDGCYGGGQKGRWFIQQESTFWRRSLWLQAGGRIACEISHAGDFDLWGRFFEHAELVGIEAPIGGFRIRAGQRVSEGTLYRDQCVERLAVFRANACWNSNVLRELGMSARLFGLPKLGGALRRIVGYNGSRVVRSDPGSQSAIWKLEKYRFP